MKHEGITRQGLAFGEVGDRHTLEQLTQTDPRVVPQLVAGSGHVGRSQGSVNALDDLTNRDLTWAAVERVPSFHPALALENRGSTKRSKQLLQDVQRDAPRSRDLQNRYGRTIASTGELGQGADGRAAAFANRDQQEILELRG